MPSSDTDCRFYGSRYPWICYWIIVVSVRILDTDLVDHTIDMAILSTPIEDDAIALSVLGRERLLIVAHRGHELVKEADSLTPAEIDGQPAVVLDELHCLGEQLEAFCTTRKLNRRIVCRSTQLATILQLVGLWRIGFPPVGAFFEGLVKEVVACHSERACLDSLKADGRAE